MIGHLGAKVSALLDGQLSAEEEERAWAHVHACHACRDAVEREGWTKTQLVGLAGAEPSRQLMGALLDPSSMRPGARAEARRRLATTTVGGAAVAAGAAVLGVLALGSSPASLVAAARTPSATVSPGGSDARAPERRTRAVAGPVSLTGVMEIANPVLTLLAYSGLPFATAPAPAHPPMHTSPTKSTRTRSGEHVRGKMIR